MTVKGELTAHPTTREGHRERARPRWKRWSLETLTLVPILAYLAVFYVYPLARILLLSVYGPRLTFDHFLRMVTVPVYTQVLMRSFRIALLVTVLSLVLGYPVAYLLSTLKPRRVALLMPVILVPFTISVLVRSYAWMAILGRQGLVNTLLGRLGLTQQPLDILYNEFGVLLGMVHILLPFFILPAYSVMIRIDRDLLKAASIMGATPARGFLEVFLPLSLPGIIGGGLLVFIQALGFFVTPALLGGPRDTMISMLIELQISQLLNWGFAAALSSVLLIATLGGFMLLTRIVRVPILWGEAR
ncbi:MAG: ABC transporter permease [Candidatus Rokuibacteriota bacterium]|nr:MAG: ABC transporter permease [Candidatus Rokubacteria bacterium]